MAWRTLGLQGARWGGQGRIKCFFLAQSYALHRVSFHTPFCCVLPLLTVRTLGLSPDFVLLNPVGFLGLAIWSWGAYFSPTARRQYAERHDGHYPQVSASDLAFSAHAALLATITLIQSAYYLRRRRATGLSVDESSPLIAKDDGTQNSPTRPSRFARGLLVFIIASTAVQTLLLSARKTELLDVLYFASTVKLIITIVKYIPQMVLNYRIKTVKGFAIAAIICVRPHYLGG